MSILSGYSTILELDFVLVKQLHKIQKGTSEKLNQKWVILRLENE